MYVSTGISIKEFKAIQASEDHVQITAVGGGFCATLNNKDAEELEAQLMFLRNARNFVDAA